MVLFDPVLAAWQLGTLVVLVAVMVWDVFIRP